MTHTDDWQGLAEVLVCPEEAGESVCLSLPGTMVAVPGEQTQLVSDFKEQTRPNEISLTRLCTETAWMQQIAQIYMDVH